MKIDLERYKKLEEENVELKIIMRKMCHEMGNALTLLGGSIFYLESEIKNKKNDIKLIDLKEDYGYICRLIGNLREYNHTETTAKSDILLTDFLDEIKEIFERLNTEEATKLTIENQIKTNKIKIKADKTKLRQVIINIIKNSIEAMEENGVDKGRNIFVRLSNDVDKEILLKESVHIEIRDNGKGIADENIENIFKPLHTYDKKNGSGLGLAIVKKIVEDHCGIIKAVSACGTGTAMHIYLPVL